MSGAGPAALDAGQYARAEIRRYEAVYGEGFVSPGGRDTAAALIARAGEQRWHLLLAERPSGAASGAG